MTETGSITRYERGLDHVVEWQIQGFSALDESDGAEYWSPAFSFGGERWRLGIYPNGWSRSDSFGFVDLWLRKYNSSHRRPIRLSFSLSLKTAKGEKYKEEHGTKDFGIVYPELSYALPRFIPRAELTRLRSVLLPDDVLTVVCTMRRSTPDGSYNFDVDDWEYIFNRFISRAELVKRKTDLLLDDVLTVLCIMKGPTPAGSDSNPGSAEICSSNSDSDSVSVECCQKCPNCSAIVKEQKKLLGDLENQKKISEGVASLCEDYKKMLSDGRHHDLILKVGGKELRAHRDVLRVRSRVFESMLDHDMKEKNTGVIDVPDCDPDAMELFLSYIYCGKIEALDHSAMLRLYYIADKYEMTELKRECSDFIKKSLSHINICSVIQLALNHSDSDLLEYANRYFANNMLDVMKTVEWQSFLKENSTVGNELLIKSLELKNAQC